MTEATTYPPDRHLLRDLRLSFAHDPDGTSRAWLPIVPQICNDDGEARSGALATLVDVIGGGLAAYAAAPAWIATADLGLHVIRAPSNGTVAAHASVLRAGRASVVLEVRLTCDEFDGLVGLATMSFTVLPRRDSNLEMEARTDERSTMALPDSGLDSTLLDALGAEILDRRAGVIEAPISAWSRNSFGAMQGGAVAALADAAAEVTLQAATGDGCSVTDLQINYLALCKVGPIRTAAEVLGVGDGYGAARVTITDTGADHRVTTIARASSTRRDHPRR